MWYCRNTQCHAKNDDSSNYCYKCGWPKKIDNKPINYNLVIIITFVVVAIAVGIWAVNWIQRNQQTGAMQNQRAAAAEATVSNRLQAADVGSIIRFGRYEQNGNHNDGYEDIEWRVLSRENGRILVISQSIIERIPYDSKTSHLVPAWDDSAVCLWLNSSFLHNAFSEDEQRQIETVTVSNSVRNSQDKVFLLSAPEARQYFRSNEDRISHPTAFIYSNNDWTTSGRAWESEEYESLSNLGRDSWLLRAEGSFAQCAAYVNGEGEIREAYGNGLGDYINGVRPAMWISTK